MSIANSVTRRTGNDSPQILQECAKPFIIQGIVKHSDHPHINAEGFTSQIGRYPSFEFDFKDEPSRRPQIILVQ